MKKDYKHQIPYNGDWKKLTGPLPVKMTNDYLFRALLQADENGYGGGSRKRDRPLGTDI